MGSPQSLYAYLAALPLKPLGSARKRFASLLISLGICSFFLPLVTLDSPVLDRTEWSALHIASKICEGKLPPPGGTIDVELIAIALMYLLMLFALIATYRPGPPRALKVISWIGVGLDWVFWLNWGPHYAMNIFGYLRLEHIRAGPAWWILPWIMPALLVICFANGLDA